jgi:hypothetical protein
MKVDNDWLPNAQAALENILFEIVDARAEIASRNRRKGPVQFRTVCASDWASQPLLSKKKQIVNDLADPVLARERCALIALAWIGELLNAKGGHDLMEEMSSKVAEDYPLREQLFLDICSKRWDGIGSWIA